MRIVFVFVAVCCLSAPAFAQTDRPGIDCAPYTKAQAAVWLKAGLCVTQPLDDQAIAGGGDESVMRLRSVSWGGSGGTALEDTDDYVPIKCDCGGKLWVNRLAWTSYVPPLGYLWALGDPRDRMRP